MTRRDRPVSLPNPWVVGSNLAGGILEINSIALLAVKTPAR